MKPINQLNRFHSITLFIIGTTTLQILLRLLQSSIITNENMIIIAARIFIENTFLFCLTVLIFSILYKLFKIDKNKNTSYINSAILTQISFFLLITGREIINIVTKINGDVTTNFLEIESKQLLNLFAFTFASPGLNGVTWGLKIIVIIFPLAVAFLFSRKGEKILRGIIAFIISYIIIFIYIITPTILTAIYKLPALDKITNYDLAKNLASVDYVLGISKQSVPEYKSITIVLPLYIIISLLFSVYIIKDNKEIRKRLWRYRSYLTWNIAFFGFGIFLGQTIYPRNFNLTAPAVVVLLTIIISIICLFLLHISLNLKKSQSKNLYALYPIITGYLIAPKISFVLLCHFLAPIVFRRWKLTKYPMLKGIMIGTSVLTSLLIGYLVIAPRQNLDLFPIKIALCILISFACGFIYLYLHPKKTFKQQSNNFIFKIKKMTLRFNKTTVFSLAASFSILLPALIFPNIFLISICLFLALIYYISQNFFSISFKQYKRLLYITSLIILSAFSLLVYYLEIKI